MNRSFKWLFMSLIIVLVQLWSMTPAWSADLTNGGHLFEVHCVGCHVNGGNIVRRGKNLQLKTLQRRELDSEAAISQLVTKGKGIMSAYGDRLTAAEIQDVSAYVLEQANQGWK